MLPLGLPRQPEAGFTTMAIIFGAILFTTLQLTSASVQTPSLKPCSGNNNSAIADIKGLTVTDLKPGKKATFNYTLELKEQLPENSVVIFTMTYRNKTVPCIGGIGSCKYNLCGRSDKIGKKIGKPWNNKCPASAGSSENSVQVRIPYLLKRFIQESTIHVKIEVVSEGKTLLCVELDLKV